MGEGIYLTLLFTAVYICARSRSEMCSWMCFHNELWKFFKVIYFTQFPQSEKSFQGSAENKIAADKVFPFAFDLLFIW